MIVPNLLAVDPEYCSGGRLWRIDQLDYPRCNLLARTNPPIVRERVRLPGAFFLSALDGRNRHVGFGGNWRNSIHLNVSAV